MGGFERSWWSDFTGGGQIYWQRMLAHDEAVLSAEAAFGAGSFVPEEDRVLLTLRMQQWLSSQTTRVSLFAFWSPSDEDGHLRMQWSYDVDDLVRLTAGVNLFEGASRNTPFGMNDVNDSVFARIRASY